MRTLEDAIEMSFRTERAQIRALRAKAEGDDKAVSSIVRPPKMNVCFMNKSPLVSALILYVEKLWLAVNPWSFDHVTCLLGVNSKVS
jgi:hypothetical protein